MLTPLLALATLGGTAAVVGARLRRHRRRRDRMYADLAAGRAERIAVYPVTIATPVDPMTLATGFHAERFARIDGFLSPDDLQALRAEAEANLERVERSYIPTHKQGGTVSYEAIHRHAPRCLSFYHSPAVQQWVSAVVGETVVPTPEQDQSSLSLLCYTQPGDHINWHFDHNFYRGRHFTVLLSLTNEGPDGLSQSTYQRQLNDGTVIASDTSPNSLVIFEGAKVLHRATPTAAGDRRLMLSMTYCADPRTSRVKELCRRVKDMAFFGLRALWD